MLRLDNTYQYMLQVVRNEKASNKYDTASLVGMYLCESHKLKGVFSTFQSERTRIHM